MPTCVIGSWCRALKSTKAALSKYQLYFLDTFDSFAGFLIICISYRKANRLKKAPKFCCTFKVSCLAFSDEMSSLPNNELKILKYMYLLLFSSGFVLKCVVLSAHC